MKFYPHYCGAFDDEKIQLLYMEFGYEGLGLFYTVLEKLAASEKPVRTKVLKSQLDVGRKLEKCWCFMEELGILSSENGQTFSKKLSKYTESLNEKRKKTAEKVSQFRENQKNKNIVTGYNTVTDLHNNNINNNITKQELNNIDTNVSIDVASSVIDPPLTKVRKSRKKNPDEYSIVHKIKVSVMEIAPGYRWNGADGKSAKELADAICGLCVSTLQREPTDEETLKYIRKMIDHIPEYWDSWTIPKLNGAFNEISAKIQKPRSRGKIMDSAIAIRQASQSLLDKGLVLTYDQYINNINNPDEEPF